MSEEVKDAPKVMMLPPTLVLMHICAGIVLNWVFPMSFGHVWGWLGLALLGAAFAITRWAKSLFEKAGTNVPPNKPAVVIVQDGPYRFTRNPMYLSFMLGFAGLAFLADAPMMMAMLLPLFYFLDQRVIAPEEEYLSAKFGDVYRDYTKKVRRWI